MSSKKFKSSNRLITNKYFWLQFLIAIILLFVAIIFINISLKRYTNHNKELEVPQVQNMFYEDVANSQYSDILNFIIIDSVYNALYEPGIIINQNPLPYSKVKPGRKVYLTIASQSPGEIYMPNLIDLSVRQALGTLETVGLQLGNVRYTPAFDKNSILKQYHNGIEIKAGDMITKGAVIDLEAGAGLDKPETELPFLYGKSPREVQLILIYSSLNIGEEQFYGSQNKDSVLAYSYQPEWYNSRIVDYGTTVNISYCSPDNYNFDSLIFIKMFGDEYYYKFFDKSKHYSKSFFDSIFKDPQIYYSIIKNDIYTE